VPALGGGRLGPLDGRGLAIQWAGHGPKQGHAVQEIKSRRRHSQILFRAMPEVVFVKRVLFEADAPFVICRKRGEVPAIITTPGTVYEILGGVSPFKLEFAVVKADAVELWCEELDLSDDPGDAAKFRPDMESAGWVFN